MASGEFLGEMGNTANPARRIPTSVVTYVTVSMWKSTMDGHDIGKNRVRTGRRQCGNDDRAPF
jgi:hypothetical protein